MQNEPHENPRVIAPPPVIYILIFILGLILRLAFPVYCFSLLARLVLSLILIGSGAFLISSAFRTMRQAKTSPSPRRPASSLISSGPFRFTRNPVYLGMNLWYLGSGIVFSPLWSLLLFPALLIIMTFGVIRREERHLEALFGETYLAYKTNVRRWI